MKTVEKQRLKGYIKQWREGKALLGCAFFIDLLKPASVLCKVLQDAEICVYQAIESMMKTKKALDKLKSTPFKELPTVKKVLTRGKELDGSFTYQGVDIKKYQAGFEYFDANHNSLIESIENCLQNRIRSQDTALLSDALIILATRGWERSDETSFAKSAIENLSRRFQVPLEKACVDISVLIDEWRTCWIMLSNTLTW